MTFGIAGAIHQQNQGGDVMILYGLKNCDTCRKALKALPDVDFRDVRADGIDPSVLKIAYDHLGDALLNTRSTTWRGLDEAERSTDPMALLQTHPTLMKRPLIQAQDQFFVGWNKDIESKLLG